MLLDSTQLRIVVDESNGEVDDPMISDEFGGLRRVGDSLAQQCFVDVDDEELAEISNKMV